MNIGTMYVHRNHCHPTSDVRATCFHSVGHAWEFDVSTKEFDEGHNCVAYQVMCWKCFLWHLFRGRILFTHSAERRWLDADLGEWIDEDFDYDDWEFGKS